MVEQQKLNKICDRIDTLKKQLDIKQKIIDKIEKLKAQCDGAPTFSIDASLPSLNINFAVFYFLKDILAILGDLKIEELRAKIINWIVSVIEPLQRRIGDLFKSGMKACYTCKVEPNIADWLFLTNPNTNSGGVGFNIMIDDIDERCLLKINPNSEYGKLKYDDGFNSFLWDVIQQNGNTVPWNNPKNGRTIAHFTFLENSPTAYVKGEANSPQTTVQEPNVINVKIDDYYHTKSLTDFTMEWLESILPLFKLESLIPQSLDTTFGVITKRLKDSNSVSDRCIEKEAIADAFIDQMLEFGIDDKDVVVDDSFFEFDERRIINIKQTVQNRKKGNMVFTDCCNKKTASITPGTVLDIGDQLSNATNDGKKVEILQNSMDSVLSQTTNNVEPVDRNKAGFEFILRLLGSIISDLFKLTNTPKNKILNQMMEYLTNGEIKSSLKKYYTASSCIWRNIISELLKKLIYELLIPWILRNLRPIILCVVGKLLKEKNKNYQLSIQSLIPGFSAIPPEKREQIIKALSKGLEVANAAGNFTNELNLGPIKEKLGLSGDGLGKFC